jgi:hypothetical protein
MEYLKRIRLRIISQKYLDKLNLHPISVSDVIPGLTGNLFSTAHNQIPFFKGMTHPSVISKQNSSFILLHSNPMWLNKSLTLLN